jgi:hypothetical protein
MRVSVFCYLFIITFMSHADAMTPISTTVSGMSSGVVISNGFFGGTVAGKIRLRLSNTPGAMSKFFTVSSEQMVNYSGRTIPLTQLPLNTEIQLQTYHGTVTNVTVSGGAQ